MGLDGGTKISRSDVLRGQSWRMLNADGSRSSRGGSVNGVYQQQQLDEATRRLVLWTCCALSGLPLAPPLVADALGQLFNKAAVLEYLLAERQVFDDEAARVRHANQQRAVADTRAFAHITSIKDVFSVSLTPNPDAAPSSAAGGGGSSTAAAGGNEQQEQEQQAAPWVCPVTLLPCTAKHPFHALRPCGHVLSGKALSALQAAGDSSCPVCGAAIEELVLLNGSAEHVAAARQQLLAKAAAKAARKAEARSKKRSAPEQPAAALPSGGSSGGTLLEAAPPRGQQRAVMLAQGPCGHAAAVAAAADTPEQPARKPHRSSGS